MSKDLAEQENKAIIDVLGIKVTSELPKTREELAKIRFTCPICHKTKTADKLVINQYPMQTEMKETSLTVTQKILICCDECSHKIGKPKEGKTKHILQEPKWRKKIKAEFLPDDSKTDKPSSEAEHQQP